MPLDPLNDPLLRAPRSHAPTIAGMTEAANTATPEQLADFVGAIGASGGGGGGHTPTDLGATATPTGVTVTSSTGADALLPLATATNAGLMAPAQHAKLADLPAAAQLAADQDAQDLAIAGKADAAHTHTPAAIGAATAVQGAKADTALQPGVLPAGTTLPAAQISDATAPGRALLTAADAAAQRTALALGNVSNTADADKPVSTAQALAIAAATTADAIADTLETAPTADLARIQSSVSGDSLISAYPADGYKSATGAFGLPTWVRRSREVGNVTPDHDIWYFYVPVSAAGDYAIFKYGKFKQPGAVNYLGGFCVGKIGSWTHHAAGSGVTKTGTWTTAAVDYAPSGSTCYSITAGDQIAFAVTGHTIVLRHTLNTNCGYMIVGIDGNFTSAANRLPVFDAADFAAGRCRSTDVGKRYVLSYYTGTTGDQHVPLASGLTDGVHTVVFEATGTKPAAASAARAHVGGVVACSASDVGQSLSAGGRAIAMVAEANGRYSAMVYTPEIERASAAGTYDFTGEVHGDEIMVSESIVGNGVSIAAMAVDTYATYSAIKITRVTTLYRFDDAVTQVCKKRMEINFGTWNLLPCTVSWSATWLIDNIRVRASYPLMLALQRTKPGAVADVGEWNAGQVGNLNLDPAAFTQTGTVQQFGNIPSWRLSADSAAHNYRVVAQCLDGGRSVDYFAGGAPDNGFIIRRASDGSKMYLAASTLLNIKTFFSGDTVGGVVGWGVAVK